VRQKRDPTVAPFGAHLRRLRDDQGLTQEQLAERAGLSTDTIRKLERGSFSPSFTTLRGLARGLQLSLAGLFVGFDGEPH
jgi:transcriptional regulator with XRE-family HTH domain